MAEFGLHIESTGQASAPHLPAYDFGEGDFTVVCMVKFPLGQPVHIRQQPLLSRMNAAGEGFVLAVDPTVATGALSFTFNASSSTYQGWSSGGAGIYDRECHCLAAVRRDSNISLYCDGQLLGVSIALGESVVLPIPVVSISSQADIVLGNTPFAPYKDAFSGTIMRAGIWSRALSVQEIMLAAFERISSIMDGLEGYWTLDNTTTDYSPNRNNLQLSGTATFELCMDCVWATGENQYVFCQMQAQGGSESTKLLDCWQSIEVAPQTKVLYAAIVSNNSAVAFPSGASLTIKDPTGKTYNEETNTDSLFLHLSNGQPFLLSMSNPPAGEWTIHLNAPSNVPLLFQLQTVPENQVPITLSNVLGPMFPYQSLISRSVQPRSSLFSPFVEAAIAGLTAVAVGGAIVAGAPAAVVVAIAAMASLATAEAKKFIGSLKDKETDERRQKVAQTFKLVGHLAWI
jgi:hypothetical protein